MVVLPVPTELIRMVFSGSSHFILVRKTKK